MVVFSGRHIVIPPGFLIVRGPKTAAAAVIPWYLSGGVTAANCLAAYTPKGAASLAASYDNNAAPGNGLADGTYDAPPGATPPAWDTTTGWQVTAGVTTPMSVAMVGNQAFSFLVRFSNVIIGARLAGLTNGSNYRLFAAPNWGASTTLYYYNTTNGTRGARALSGVIGMAATQPYLNGVVDGAAFTGATFTTDTFKFFLTELGAYLQAYAIYNTTLTAPQVAYITDSMNQDPIAAVTETRTTAPALAGGVDPSNLVAYYQPKGAPGQASAHINLANPGTYDAVPGVEPAWDAATGWTFNGSSQYLNTGYTLPTATQAAITVIARYSALTLGADWAWLFGGTLNTAKGFGIEVDDDAGNRYRYNNGSYVQISNDAPASGVMAIAGAQGYLNGAANGAAIAVGNTYGTLLYIGAYAAGSNVPTSFAAYACQALAIYDATLTPTQVGLISTAMAAL